jgi:Family of unknown function (DUF5572)
MEPQVQNNTINESAGSELPASGPQSQLTSYNGHVQDEAAIFSSISRYPFDTDPEYLNGLATILGHPSALPSPSEVSQNADLVLQAQCFYFARKHGLPPIDPSGYRTWLQTHSSNAPASLPAAGQASDIPAPAAQAEPATASSIPSAPITTETTDERPPYPTSFEAIVDLITRNEPIPGIEEIPTTVLDHGSSKVDHTPRRKKPWETDAASAEESAAIATAAEGADSTGSQAGGDVVNGHLTTGEGVVKILQPNAIPDSGLLAKD